MKKTNFFKLFLVGAIALTVGLASCQDSVSQKDFEAACERISTLEDDIEEIQDKLNSLGDVVKNVTNKTGDPYTLIVTYTNGTTAEVKLPVPENTTTPTPSPGFVYIKDGNWWIDGVDTGEKANALTPRINTSAADGQYYWEFPVVNAAKDIEWVKGPKAIAAAYAVENNGVWTLWLPTKSDMSKLSPIVLPSGGGNLGKVDILGWVTGYEAGDDLTKRGHYELDQTPSAEGETDETRPDGVIELHNSGADYDIFWVNYAWIQKFRTDGAGYPTGEPENSFDSGTLADRSPNSWNADGKQGKETVKVKEILNTLKGQRQGFIIQVSPATYDISNLKLELRATKEGSVALPIGFGDAELVTGMLTRATSPNALYFIPGDITAELFEAPQLTSIPAANGTQNTTNRDYEARFYPNAVYSLNVINAAGSTVSSEYTNFTIEPNPVISEEAPVEWIVATDEKADKKGKEVIWGDDTVNEEEHVYGGAYTDEEKPGIEAVDEGIVYVVELWDNEKNENWYKPYFDPTDDLEDIMNTVGEGAGDNHIPPHPGGKTNNVVDYYLELVDTHGLYDDEELDDIDATYIKAQFGLEFNATATAFRVTRLPDRLTLAWFDLNVYKLGIDGVVYKETFRIRPVRSGLITRIPAKYYEGSYTAGTYPIFDINYDVAGAAHEGVYDNSVDIEKAGGPMIFDLTPMFDQLKNIPDGTAGANLAQRWQEAPIRGGVTGYTIRRMEIFNPKVSETEAVVSLEGPFGGISPATDATPLGKVLLNAETALVNGGQIGTGANNWEANRNALYADATADQATILTGHNNIVPKKATEGGANSTTITTAMNEVLSITLQPQWSVDGVDYMFDVDNRYELTVEFYDRDGDYVNTVILYFTPVIPPTALIEKDEFYWNDGSRGKGQWNNGADDVLNAFYKAPLTWATGMAPNGTRYDIAVGRYSQDLADAAATAPQTAGGNGGFLKLNIFPYSGPAWATLNYVPKYANPTLGTVASGVVYPTTTATGVGPEASPWTTAATKGTATVLDNIVTLEGQYVTTAVPFVHSDVAQAGWTDAQRVAAKNFYGQILNMTLPATSNKYLDVYAFDASKYEFKMRIMSQLYEGWISVDTEKFADGVIKVPASTGTRPSKLENVFIGHTYNGKDSDKITDQTAYSIFKIWDDELTVPAAVYEYTYIDKVEFSAPAGDTSWWITSANGEDTINTAVDPTDTTESALYIQSNPLSESKPTWLIVKVYDRFGKIKAEALPIDITVGGLAPTAARPAKPTL